MIARMAANIFPLFFPLIKLTKGFVNKKFPLNPQPNILHPPTYFLLLPACRRRFHGFLGLARKAKKEKTAMGINHVRKTMAIKPTRSSRPGKRASPVCHWRKDRNPQRSTTTRDQPKISHFRKKYIGLKVKGKGKGTRPINQLGRDAAFGSWDSRSVPIFDK
jgi:hypothetical protein